MAGKIEGMVKDLAKVRGEIAVAKMRLAQGEERERELLRQILELFTDESGEMESPWNRQVAGDIAVVKIEEGYFVRPAVSRHEAVNVGFIPLVQQAL